MKGLAPAAGVALVLGGCTGAQSALDPAADQSAAVMDLWTLLMWICGGMYALVLGFLALAIWRHRAVLASPLAGGPHSGTERPLQRTLGVWILLIVAGLTTLTLGSFMIDRRLAMAGAQAPLRIKVTASQWWWNIEYEDSDPSRRITTANEIHLPLGQPVRFELHADDVIHSFWLPNLTGKQDLIPGRTNAVLVTPRRPGRFRGQCAEFCGLEHALMALDVTVESPADFEAWREAQLRPAIVPTAGLALRGQKVFIDSACASCHQIRGLDAAGRTGPDLTHVGGRRTLAAGALSNDPSGFTAWMRDPQAVKPGAHMPRIPLAEADIQALAAYLDGLQ